MTRQYMYHPVGQEKKKTILEREKREKEREERKKKKDEKVRPIDAESNNGVDGGSSSGSELPSSSSASGINKVVGDGGASGTIDIDAAPKSDVEMMELEKGDKGGEEKDDSMEEGSDSASINGDQIATVGIDGRHGRNSDDCMVEEGGEGGVSRGRTKRIFGLYQMSLKGGTHLTSRDINAAVNILQIAYSLRDFGEIPWEFRKDVGLRKLGGCNKSREYNYTAKVTNKHGQIMKFSRKEVVDLELV
jgi:hypothetical protein